jgi:hypothetical protein
MGPMADFYRPKNPLSQLGLNPQIFTPMARSTLTIMPQRQHHSRITVTFLIFERKIT